MISTDDAEADDVAIVVQDLQPLGAVHGWEARYDVDFTEGADVTAVAVNDVATLDKVLLRRDPNLRRAYLHR